jgi:hypothetical protein
MLVVLLMLMLILPANAKDKNIRDNFRDGILEIIEASYEFGVFSSEDCAKYDTVNSVKYNDCIKNNLKILKSNVNRININDCKRSNCNNNK